MTERLRKIEAGPARAGFNQRVEQRAIRGRDRPARPVALGPAAPGCALGGSRRTQNAIGPPANAEVPRRHRSPAAPPGRAAGRAAADSGALSRRDPQRKSPAVRRGSGRSLVLSVKIQCPSGYVPGWGLGSRPVGRCTVAPAVGTEERGFRLVVRQCSGGSSRRGAGACTSSPDSVSYSSSALATACSPSRCLEGSRAPCSRPPRRCAALPRSISLAVSSEMFLRCGHRMAEEHFLGRCSCSAAARASRSCRIPSPCAGHAGRLLDVARSAPELRCDLTVDQLLGDRGRRSTWR